VGSIQTQGMTIKLLVLENIGQCISKYSYAVHKAASSNKVLTQQYMYKIHHMVSQFVCGELHVGVYSLPRWNLKLLGKIANTILH
jgi:hypothetical protein